MQALLILKIRGSKGTIFLVQDSRLGNLVWGLGSSLLEENLHNCDYPPVLGLLPLGVTVLCNHPFYLSHCGSFSVSLIVEDLFSISLFS